MRDKHSNFHKVV